MYRVLYPVYQRVMKNVLSIDKNSGRAASTDWYEVDFVQRGFAEDMDDAKAKFGGAPVLEWVRPLDRRYA